MGSYYKQQLNDWVEGQFVKGDLVYDIGGSQNPIKAERLVGKLRTTRS